MKISTIITSVIGAVVGLAMYPVVQESAATAATNATGFAAAVIPLVPLFYAIMVLVGTAAFAYTQRD